MTTEQTRRRRRGRAIRKHRRRAAQSLRVDRLRSYAVVEISFDEVVAFQDRLNVTFAKLAAITGSAMDQLVDATRLFARAVSEPTAGPARQLLRNGRAPRRGRG